MYFLCREDYFEIKRAHNPADKFMYAIFVQNFQKCCCNFAFFVV